MSDLQAGDREVILASVKNMENNIRTVVGNIKENRTKIDYLETQLLQARDAILNKDQELNALREQIQVLQVKLFSGGATHGNNN